MKITDASIEQFRQFVQLKDLRPVTQAEYLRYLRRVAEHFTCDPATLTEPQLREYFLYLRETKHLAGSSLSVARAALRCFFLDGTQLAAHWTVFSDFKIRRPKTLPVVLSREHVT